MVAYMKVVNLSVWKRKVEYIDGGMRETVGVAGSVWGGGGVEGKVQDYRPCRVGVNMAYPKLQSNIYVVKGVEL